MGFGIVLLILVVLAGAYVISLYNGLVTLKHNREEAFATIDVHLNQRMDLIPQLVECVKGYVKHEEKSLQMVVEARNGMLKAGSINEKIQAEVQMNAAMNGLRVTMEAYPDLKASQNFINLQMEIGDVENKLAATRRYFNSATREYNVAIASFPANLIAPGLGHQKEDYFELDDNKKELAQEAPKLGF